MTLPPPQAPPGSINYVFVDFENVHEVDLTVIGEKEVIFTLLIGASQKKLDVALVERLLECSATVKLVRLTSSGKNALDFALAYYAGRAAASDPSGYVHIVSKDGGFDPLIEHLRSKGTRARRHDSFASLCFRIPVKAKEPAKEEDPLQKVLGHFRKNVNNRPKRKKTLLAHLTSAHSAKLGGDGVSKLIERLVAQGYLAIDSKELVTYHLPK